MPLFGDSVMLGPPAHALGKNEKIDRQTRKIRNNRALLFTHIVWCFLYLYADRGVIDGQISG